MLKSLLQAVMQTFLDIVYSVWNLLSKIYGKHFNKS